FKITIQLLVETSETLPIFLSPIFLSKIFAKMTDFYLYYSARRGLKAERAEKRNEGLLWRRAASCDQANLRRFFVSRIFRCFFICVLCVLCGKIHQFFLKFRLLPGFIGFFLSCRRFSDAFSSAFFVLCGKIH